MAKPARAVTLANNELIYRSMILTYKRSYNELSFLTLIHEIVLSGMLAKAPMQALGVHPLRGAYSVG